MSRVDAHHHVWTIARGDYGWIVARLSIARDYGLDDLRPLLGDITATVLVQAADTEAETAFMLDVAPQLGGAGAGRVADQPRLARRTGAHRRACRRALLKGLRPIAAGHRRHSWILLPPCSRGSRRWRGSGLRFDAIAQAAPPFRHRRACPAPPDLAVVIDHAPSRTSPTAASSLASHMARLAGNAVVLASCRASSPKPRADWQIDDYIPTSITLLATFGLID